MRFCVASDIAKQGLVVDLTDLFSGQAQCAAEAHCKNAGSQRELNRLPHGEVGRHGQAREYFSSPDWYLFSVSHVPNLEGDNTNFSMLTSRQKD